MGSLTSSKAVRERRGKTSDAEKMVRASELLDRLLSFNGGSFESRIRPFVTPPLSQDAKFIGYAILTLAEQVMRVADALEKEDRK